MLTKFVLLFSLSLSCAFFNNHLNAMEVSLHSLKELAALRVNQSIILAHKKILPDEIREYCNYMEWIVRHCISLELFKDKKYVGLSVTHESLCEYKSLLVTILNKNFVRLELIIDCLSDYFKSIHRFCADLFPSGNPDLSSFITLKDINALLQLIIKRADSNKSYKAIEKTLSKQEMDQLYKVVYYALTSSNMVDTFCRLLIHTDLFPSLEFIHEHDGSLLGTLLRNNISLELFNMITKDEKVIGYDWKKIAHSSLMFHDAMYSDKEILIALVELLKEKNLNVDTLINEQDHEGKTALMEAIINGNVQYAALLINYGAKLDLVSKERLTVLQYAENAMRDCNEDGYYFYDGEISKEIVTECINLLKKALD